MTNISFKYYTIAGAWSSSKTLPVLRYINIPYTEQLAGTTLNSRNYNHLTAYRNKYTFVITADTLFNTSNYNFLKNMFLTKIAKFSLDLWTTESIIILQDDNDFPEEHIDDNTYLKEITITAFDKSPLSGGY